MPTRPAVVGAAPALPCASRLRLPQLRRAAATARRRSLSSPLDHMTPRGAQRGSDAHVSPFRLGFRQLRIYGQGACASLRSGAAPTGGVPGGPARPLTPERPHPHTPEAPPRRHGGAASATSIVEARPSSRACRRLRRWAGQCRAGAHKMPGLLLGPSQQVVLAIEPSLRSEKPEESRIILVDTGWVG